MTEIDALCGGGKMFAIFDMIARYISVTAQYSPIIAARKFGMVTQFDPLDRSER